MYWKITYIPDPTTVTYTLGEFLNSIERNGLPQKKGDYWVDRKGLGVGDGHRESTVLEVTSACAMGQSALNLEVGYNELVRIINKQFRTKGKRGLADAIIGRNDGHRWSYRTIAIYYRKKFANRLNETFTVQRIISVDKEPLDVAV